MHRKKYLAISLSLIWQAAFAQVIGDQEKLDQIDSPIQGIEVLKEIITHKLDKSDQELLKQTRKNTHRFFIGTHLTQPEDAEAVLWKCYWDFVKAYSTLNGTQVDCDPQFNRFGLRQGVVDSRLNRNFLDALELSNPISFSAEDCDLNYSYLYPKERGANTKFSYFMFEDLQIDTLKSILFTLKEPIAQCLGTPWRVVNIRAWKTLSDREEFGLEFSDAPNTPPSLFKIFFYPEGTLPLGCLEDSLDSTHEKGLWIIYKNADAIQRAKLPNINNRKVVEISIVPSLEYNLDPVFAGLNAYHPKLPWQKPHLFTTLLYEKKQSELILE